MKFDEMLKTATDILESQPRPISVLSNAAAFLMDMLDDINWVGFYLYDGQKLVVGPFQGHVACSSIAIGKGVCGEAARDLETKVVLDVLAYDNHIACDANSRSEVVVPLSRAGKLFGVLDCDSPTLARFDQDTIHFLEAFGALITKIIDFSAPLV